MLKQVFLDLVSQYTPSNVHALELWHEIETQYAEKSRHYHTLFHLENLLAQLGEIKKEIRDWNCILFTLFYHDVVYNTVRQDNEEKSAEFAATRMMSIGVPQEMIRKCSDHILATKSHIKSDDPDANFFTDADLSILGAVWENYSAYSKQVREEYSIYPKILYNTGRKKVLQHFLQMDRIYKTDHFFGKFEVQARENMKKEMEML